jgi:hypothetical protein
MARACFGEMSRIPRRCFSCCLGTDRNQLSPLGLLPALPDGWLLSGVWYRSALTARRAQGG